MENTNTDMPDLLARPLSYALQVLEQAGWKAQVVRAEPFFHRDSLVWQDAHAYILKQTAMPDHIVKLIVGCKFEGRCTDYGTQD
jgi:hypothetical protein